MRLGRVRATAKKHQCCIIIKTRAAAQQALTWKLKAARWTTPPTQQQKHRHPCPTRMSGHKHSKLRTRGTCSRAT